MLVSCWCGSWLPSPLTPFPFSVSCPTRPPAYNQPQRRKLCVSRFWQLDDDGVYLVTYSSVKDEAVTPSLTVGVVSVEWLFWMLCGEAHYVSAWE